MTVKVTIEFPNVDAAIVALGKLTKAADTVIVDGKPRKGRNDKGKPRGPHTPSGGGVPLAPELKAGAAASATPSRPAAAEDTTPTAASPAAPTASAAAPASSGETVAVAAEADAQKALEKLFALPPEKGGGIDGARDAMARFGVKRLRELPADQRAAFIAHVEGVIAGGKA